MLNQFSRTELLIGASAVQALSGASVAVFGIGGVGSYAVEALARSGIGSITLVDDDRICLTNLNRHLIATRKTVGAYKVEAMRERILEINPSAGVEVIKSFYTAENADSFELGGYDYIIDAMDTVACKLTLILKARASGIPVISCMATGNKLDPTLFRVADIYSTSICPLSRIMRKELRKLGVDKLKVVYSEEKCLTPQETDELSCKRNCICPPGTIRTCSSRRQVPGSISFVPAVAGLILAGEVIKELAFKAEN